MPDADIPDDIAAKYQVRDWRNAIVVLKGAYPEEWADIIKVLREFRLARSWIETSGGRLTQISGAIDGAFRSLGWRETGFDTRVTVDHRPGDTFNYDSPTHKVDSYKNNVGVEMEWNNKDTFFDRDLNNFRLLFELRVIGVGVIITRDEDIKDLAVSLGRSPGTYGSTTTHWKTLIPRMEGGGGGGCPILAFGITKRSYDPHR